MNSPSHNGLVSAANGVERAIGAVCSLIILATTLILLFVLGFNVVARYAFEHGGLHWAGETAEQLFPWMIAAGITLAVQHGAHIAVDILFNFLGPRAARVLAILIHVLVAVAYVVLLIVALRVAEIVSIERSSILQVSRSWGYYALAFAAAGTAVGNLIVALRVALVGLDGLPKASPEESPV